MLKLRRQLLPAVKKPEGGFFVVNLFQRVGLSLDAGEMFEEVAIGFVAVELLEVPLALRDASDIIPTVGILCLAPGLPGFRRVNDCLAYSVFHGGGWFGVLSYTGEASSTPFLGATSL